MRWLRFVYPNYLSLIALIGNAIKNDNLALEITESDTYQAFLGNALKYLLYIEATATNNSLTINI